MSEQRELAIRPVDNLIAAAVEKDLDVDKLERLIDMRNKELERQAKLDYDEHFAAMQLDYVPVGKSKAALDRDGRKVLYKYCPLEDILRVYQPIISKHGFSYRWSEETLTPTEKRMWCIVAGYGHEERSYVDIPIQAASAFTNAVQQRGSATTYGKRYSFIDAFGVIIDGEDDDATGVQEKQSAKNNARQYAQDAEVIDEYRERLDSAVASGSLTEQAASIWRDRLGNPGLRKGAEDWIKANVKVQTSSPPEEVIKPAANSGQASDFSLSPEAPEDTKQLWNDLIEWGNVENIPAAAKKEVEAALIRNEQNPIELRKLLNKVKTACGIKA